MLFECNNLYIFIFIVIEKKNAEIKVLSSNLEERKVDNENEVKSLKQMIADSEHLMDKIKNSYDQQIENFNAMSDKLTGYIRDKSSELEVIKKEKEQLQQTVENNKIGIFLYLIILKKIVTKQFKKRLTVFVFYLG